MTQIIILFLASLIGCRTQQPYYEEQEKYILHLEEGWQNCQKELSSVYDQLNQWQTIAIELDSTLKVLIKEREED